MKINNNRNIVLVIIPVLLFLHLIFEIYLKYYINDLTYSSFRLNYLGNIFNIFFFVVIITGYGVGVFFNSIKDRKDLLIILFLVILIFVPWIIVLLINGLELSFGTSYLFGIPLKRIISGILFFGELLFQLYLLFLIWSFIIDNKNISHIRSIYLSLISILFILFFSFFYLIEYSDSFENIETNSKFDVAVILGAAVWSYDKPSPIFEGRIKKAFDLYTNGVVKKIQLTGGNAPGEISEAVTASNYLINLGVDSKDINIEENTSTTTEQVEFIKNDLIGKQHSEKIVIVSDGFHLSRVLEICKFYDVDAAGVSSDYDIKWGKLLFYRIRESIALLMFWLFAI